VDLLRAPWVLAVVAVSAASYWRGSRRPNLRVVAGAILRRRLPWRGLCFAAGLAVLVVALDSPVDRLAADWFWVHMLQHVLLMMVAAPLLVLGAPWMPFWRSLPPRLRKRLEPTHGGNGSPGWLRGAWAVASAPRVAWLLFDVDLAVWHVPALYELTLRNVAVHDIEHILFLLLGMLFWIQVIESPPFHARLSSFGRVVYATAGSAASWLLALVLALSTTPLYPSQSAEHHAVSALADQQLAAGVMVGPGSVPYAIVVFYWLYIWLGADEAGGLVRTRHSTAGTEGR
jgi:cytochrome c oxidase assembly factor CtaG